MSVTTASKQAVIQSAVQKSLTVPLEQESVFLSSGVKIIDSASPVSFPVLTDDLDAPGYVSEDGLIPDTDLEIGGIPAMPSTMQGHKVIVKVSNLDLRSTVVDLSSLIQQRLVAGIRAQVDKAMLGAGGDGVSTIRGIFNRNLPTFDVDGELTFDAMLAAKAKIQRGYVSPTSLRWFIHPADIEKLEAVKDSDGHYLWSESMTEDGVMKFKGVPVVVTDRLPDTQGATPTGRALLADMSGAVVVRDLSGLPRVELTPDL